jgi:hypothetical protein
LPLQSNSVRHLTPLFWYLGFHGNFILNAKQIAIGWTSFAAVVMEIKKGGFRKEFDFS